MFERSVEVAESRRRDGAVLGLLVFHSSYEQFCIQQKAQKPDSRVCVFWDLHVFSTGSTCFILAKDQGLGPVFFAASILCAKVSRDQK